MRFSIPIAGAIALCLCAVPARAEDGVWRPETITKVPGLIDVTVNRDNGRVILMAPERQFRLTLVRGRTILSPLKAKSLNNAPSDAIPDSRMGSGTGAIARAWLVDPTAIYNHAVLGDRIEATSLKVETKSGRVLSHRLPDDSVFEDLEPRIVSLDGTDAVLLVRSYLEKGAAVALYHVADDRIETLAESRSIGWPHRWLNPVGAADFTGDGRVEVAAVVTPHLAGTLTLYRRDGRRLTRVAARDGYSTHFIGSTVLAMSTIADVDGDGVVDIVLPSLDRHDLAAVTFAGGDARELRSVSHNRPIATAINQADVDKRGDLDFIYGLDDGSIILIRR